MEPRPDADPSCSRVVVVCSLAGALETRILSIRCFHHSRVHFQSRCCLVFREQPQCFLGCCRAGLARLYCPGEVNQSVSEMSVADIILFMITPAVADLTCCSAIVDSMEFWLKVAFYLFIIVYRLWEALPSKSWREINVARSSRVSFVVIQAHSVFFSMSYTK
jgi:hypothetical protein